jgi:hypothetical protein
MVKAQYRKKPTEKVVAVQLDLETKGFTYEKWGGTQVCKPGDWLINNNGDVYTIDQQTFADTYEEAGLGRYAKTGTVWAEIAEEAGVVTTKEGSTEYQAGDYLVYNDEAGEDRYAVSRGKFELMYEIAGDEG